MTLAEKRDSKPAAIKDAAFDWEDPLDLESELTEEERMVRDTARGYAQDKLFPRVLTAYRDERYDPEVVREMGELGLLGADHSGGIRRRGSRLRRLRADRPRDRARRFRLPLGDVGAVVAGDASDLRIRQRGAAQEVPAEARVRRDGRLLRPDRARLRLRSGLDGDARREGRRAASGSTAPRCGSPTRRSPTSRWCGRSSTASSAASSSSAAPRDSRRRRSRASCRCAPRSPARSCWRTPSCRRRTCCRT